MMKFKPIKLNGKRVILRRLEMKDARQIAKIANDFKVAQYLATVPYPYTLNHAEKWIKHSWKKKDGYDLGIALKENDMIIGGVGIHHIGDKSDNKTGELGYWIGRKYWKQRYGKEASKLMINHMFSKFGLRKIYARVYGPNIGSQKLLESLGFKKEGILREQIKYRFGNRWLDEVYYGLLRGEWKK